MNMATKKKSEFVRNLRGTPVHIRCNTLGHDKPFRIELKPRGEQGDVKEIPISVVNESIEFSGSLGVLFEVIPRAEALELQQTYPAVGYQGGVPRSGVHLVGGELVDMPLKVEVSRESERDVARFVETDRGLRRSVGPNIVDMPGSDPALTAMHQQAARAEGLDPTEALSNEEAVKRALVQRVINEHATEETIVVDRDLSHPAARGKTRAPRAAAPDTGKPSRKPSNRSAKVPKTRLAPKEK